MTAPNSSTGSSSAIQVLLTALIALLMVGVCAAGEAETDPHRPACTTVQCRKIKSFLKAHYCGQSPEGNGPDDGCDIVPPKKPDGGAKVLADFDCKWIDGARKCQQHGQPSSEARSILMSEMRNLGLPANIDKQIYFTVWEDTESGWSLAAADYHHSAQDDLTLCQVIVTIDQNSHVHLLRKVRFQKTDVDKPAVTTWFPIALADVDGDGQIDAILEGDAYEDHWLEVDSVQDGSSRTIFSGLGYYL
jgi:hypothetical protein